MFGVSPAIDRRVEVEDEIDATDAARRDAKKVGIDLSEIKGTGSGGRIIQPDVLEAAQAGEDEAGETDASAGESRDAHVNDFVTVDDPVEKMVLGVVLGGTPDESLAVLDDPAANLLDADIARLETVRSFLANQPDLLEKFAQEVDEAWGHADGQPEKFLADVAQLRAEILTRAELEQLQRLAPLAAANLRNELSWYLIQKEGFGIDGAV